MAAGLLGRDARTAPELEVSLLGAALALQAQRFVAWTASTRARRGARRTPTSRPARTRRVEALEALDPYYRAHACADGFVALACLNTAQRLRVCELFGLEDPFAGNPQAEPADADEHERRAARTCAPSRTASRGSRVREAVDALGARGVPASEVRSLDQLFDDEQVRANGLVQAVEQPGVGAVRLLGSPFKVDGEPLRARRARAPRSTSTPTSCSERRTRR